MLTGAKAIPSCKGWGTAKVMVTASRVSDRLLPLLRNETLSWHPQIHLNNRKVRGNYRSGTMLCRPWNQFTDKCGMDAGAARATYFWRKWAWQLCPAGGLMPYSRRRSGHRGSSSRWSMPGRVAAQPDGGKPVGCHCLTYRANQMFRAGQPEYVGVKPITHPSPICVHYAPCLNQ